jgi:hypothetical protein
MNHAHIVFPAVATDVAAVSIRKFTPPAAKFIAHMTASGKAAVHTAAVIPHITSFLQNLDDSLIVVMLKISINLY